MMLSLRVLLWSLLTAALGCAALQSPSTGRGKSDDAWREFRSKYETHCAILFAGDPGAAAPAHVVLFAHGADLPRFIPPGAVAAFFSELPDVPESKATMLLETSFNEEVRRLFIHEMTHAFIRRSFSRVPIWLDEGLAKYFETHDYLEYLRSDSLEAGFLAIDVPTKDKVASEDRVMPPQEVEALWARLRRVAERH